MDKEEIFMRVRQIVAEHLDLDPSCLEEGTTFADVGADSLDVVEILMELEEKLEIEIPDAKVEGVQSLGQLVEVIAALI